VVAWPLAARAQQLGRVRRIGVLLFGGENEPASLSRVTAFKNEFNRLGWIEPRNVVIEVRFAGGNPDKFRDYSAELVGLAPDLIVCQSGTSARAVQARTKTIPLLFVEVGDPFASGLVQNVARPEANATAITNLFASIGGKWLELLRDAVPHVTRVLLLLAEQSAGSAFLPAIEAAATTYRIEARRFSYRNVADIERAIREFAVESNGGVIVVPPTPTETDLLIIKRALTAHRLPAVYQYKLAIASGGGLISYGSDTLDLYRGAAGSADRILRVAKSGDVLVQFSTKFELVVNLKTAKAIGLTIPETFLVRADEVIE
jgi:putative ABC transport system substrate-binding protein